LSIVAFVSINAQITGEIVDKDGYAIPYASAMYKGHHIATASDMNGAFTIERHEGWTLTISSVGFRSQTIKIDASTPSHLKIVLKEDSKSLNEVIVKSKRARYSRKDNPAVALMRRVIAAKSKTHLDNHDYYQFNKYQKITLSMNDLQPKDLETGMFKKSSWLLDQIETSPYNNKLILPLSVDETVTQHVYRKNPKTEREIVMGQKTEGINKVIQTGEIINTLLKDIFTDVDIYDDYVRLLQYPFTSPIGKTAISFYRYYIQDTVYVDRDLCYHINFIPNNQQDFGFRGDLYVLADSTLHVKKCTMTIPARSDVNFVENMKIEQEYTRLPDGDWVLTKDDMFAELKLNKLFNKLLVVRTTRLSDYAFDELPNKLFKGKAKVRHEADAMIRDEAFWEQYRTVDLTRGETSMNSFIHKMQQSKGYKWVIFGVRAFLENYVETGSTNTPSKFDIGPVTTMVSSNFIDGLRFRLSGRTTANLNKHWFWSGYYAYGSKSHKHYYSSEVTYSLNKKKNLPFEFPQRNITFETSYDIMSPSDKFLRHNKDNIFMAFRTQKVQQMYFYNRQKLSFDYETDWGFSFNTSLKAESNEPTGNLVFKRMPASSQILTDPFVDKIRTTELAIGIRYNPGQTYMNTKQRRWPVNLDSPEFKLSHTMGLSNVLGGQYQFNRTELGVYKRFWMGSWGYVDTHLNGGIEWNKVPFPLLIMPPVNLSFFEHENTFSMMKNMEFLNDRYAFWSVAWDLNGKILNRLPLVKHLKWREYVAFKGMWGTLTDKNNPRLLTQNATDELLFELPSTTQLMDKKVPYMELVVGVHNIFKFFAIDYVHRFNYNDVPGTKKNGIRFGFNMSF
jgi:putative outer membrane protein